jgi:hypothetical protein
MIKTRTADPRSLFLVVSLLALNGCDSSNGSPSPSPPGFSTITFPNGNVQFFAPETYTHQSEPNDTVAITLGDESGIVVRFNLHNLPDAVAEDFLHSQANDKGLQINRIGNKATFSETGARSEGGRDYVMTFWQVGFGDALVVISAEVDREQEENQTVKDCLNRVPKMIESMQRY